jgi:hypothetical protein
VRRTMSPPRHAPFHDTCVAQPAALRPCHRHPGLPRA